MTDDLHQHGPDCMHDGDVPIAWRAAAMAARITGERLLPSQPPGWVDPDPLYVEPEPVIPQPPRGRYHGWQLDELGWRLDPKPISVPWALVIVAFCAGVLAGALILTIARTVDATPRSTAETAIPTVTATPIERASGNLAPQSSGAPLSFPGSDPAGHRGDGGSIPQAVPGGAPTPSAVTPVPSPSGEIGSALIGGWATYFATCSDCAAAGPLLQAALGRHWKGQTIHVVSDVGQLDLRLVTSCACGDRRGKPTIIDVSIPAFNELSSVAAGADADPGLVAVWIEIPGPRPTLPPTDTPRHPDDLRMMLEARDDEWYR